MKICLIKTEDTLALRRTQLYAEDARGDVSYPGDVDSRTLHVGTFIGVSLVGVASFIPQDLPSKSGGFRIRGVVVLPAVNRQGVGRNMVQFGIEEVQKQGGTYVWCNAREASLPFFESLGFVSISDLFDLEATGLHRRMVKRLTQEATR